MKQQTFFDNTKPNKKDWYSQLQKDEERLLQMVKYSSPANPIKTGKEVSNNGKK